MLKTTLIMTLAVLALATTGPAFAAAGDSCNEAIEIQTGSTFSEMGNGSKWYSFVALENGNFPINTSRPGTQFDTRIAVFGACGGAPIADNAGAGERRAHAVVSAFPGQRLFIEVSRIGSGGSQFELSINDPRRGPNCPGGGGDCFVANGTPGCDDICGGPPCPNCCFTVCSADAFCCDVDWDGVCAAAATTDCVVIPVELKNFEIDG